MTDSINFDSFMTAIDAELGLSDCDMHRDRAYQGQDHSWTGARGQFEVSNVSFRDLRDAFIRGSFMCAYNQSPELYHEANLGEEGLICSNDLYTINLGEIDPMAIFQNMACEIEKMMGIYPNIPGFPRETH
jgi:hypothetical protein